MAKTDQTTSTSKMNYIKNTFYIILSLIAIGGALFGIERYFAKSEQVQKLESHDKLFEERLDISILDDRIYQQSQQISRIQDLTMVERTERALTEAEKEVLKNKKEELEELKRNREQKIKYYEERRK